MDVVRPSVNARWGSWHVAQATVPSTDSLPSKKRFWPSATLSADFGLSGGMAASVLSTGKPACLVDRGCASGPGLGMGGGLACCPDADGSVATEIKPTITTEAQTPHPIDPPRPMLAFDAAGRPISQGARGIRSTARAGT